MRGSDGTRLGDLLLSAAEHGDFEPHVPPDAPEQQEEPRDVRRLDAPCSREFTAIRTGGTRETSAIRLVILHCTQSNSARSSAMWFTNPRCKGSAHLCVDGSECYRTLADKVVPWAARGTNTPGLHLELAGWAEWTRDEWLEHEPAIRRGAYHAAKWAKAYAIPISLLSVEQLRNGARGFATHALSSAAFDPGGHWDPGPNFPLNEFMRWTRDYADGGPGEPKPIDHDADWPWFVEWALWWLGRGLYFPFGERNPAVRPRAAPRRIPPRAWQLLLELQDKTDTVNVESPLLSPPRAEPKTLEQYVLGRDHELPDADAREIVGHYVDVSRRGGLDPLLAVTQMVLETGNLSSRWAKTHRNLAGIGVTSDDVDPEKVPKFPTWEAAVVGHVGRLLAYAIPKGREDGAQQILINAALQARPLTNRLRGSAPRLGDLTGKWATKPTYGDDLSRLANEIQRS